MDIRLVAVDLDGTLLKNDKSLSRETILAVERASRCGVEVAIATGRTLCEFQALLEQLPTVRFAVACTGASVLDCRTGRKLFNSPLRAQTVRDAWHRLKSFDVLFEVFQDGKIYVDAEKFHRMDSHYMAASRNPGLPGTRTPREEFDRWLETQEAPVSKIHMFFPNTPERDAAWDTVRDLKAFVCSSDDVDLEIMAEDVDKGTGLSQLAGYLGLRRDQVMAVGDSGNDLGMLQYAGTAAVMANGASSLMDLADVIADTNERDGVAKLLDSLSAGWLNPDIPTPRKELTRA